MSISDISSADYIKSKKLTDDFICFVIDMFDRASKQEDEGRAIKKDSFMQTVVISMVNQLPLKLPSAYLSLLFPHYKTYLSTGDKKIEEDMRNLSGQLEFILLMSVRIREMEPDDTFIKTLRYNMILYKAFNSQVLLLYDITIGSASKYNIITILCTRDDCHNDQVLKDFEKNAKDVSIIHALSNLRGRVSENKFDNICTLIVYATFFSEITCDATIDMNLEQEGFIESVIDNVVGVDDPNYVNDNIVEKVNAIEQRGGKLPVLRYKQFDLLQILPHSDDISFKLRTIINRLPKYLYVEDEITLEPSLTLFNTATH